MADYLLQLLSLAVVLVALGWPLSTWLAHVYATDADWRGERLGL